LFNRKKFERFYKTQTEIFERYKLFLREKYV